MAKMIFYLFSMISFVFSAILWMAASRCAGDVVIMNTPDMMRSMMCFISGWGLWILGYVSKGDSRAECEDANDGKDNSSAGEDADANNDQNSRKAVPDENFKTGEVSAWPAVAILVFFAICGLCALGNMMR